MFFRDFRFINFFIVDLQLERGNGPDLEDLQGPPKKRKEEILPLTVHLVRKKGKNKCTWTINNFLIFFKEGLKRRGPAQAPLAVTQRMKGPRRPSPERTKTKDRKS